MDMAVLSLILFCATLVVAVVFKINTGLVALVVSLVLSWVAGVPEKFLLNAFDSKMFLMLFGVMYLFSIAQENKTLELLSKKTFALCRGNTKLLPIVVFFVAAVIAAIGPGPISVSALIAVLVVPLAAEVNIPFIHLASFGLLGSFAGGLTPITPSGIVAVNKAEESGIFGVGTALPLKMALTCVIYGIILYFFIFKWHKRASVPTQAGDASAPFSVMQIATLLGIVIVAVVSTVFGVNVGLISFAVSVVLTLFKAADEGAALKKVPWSTLIMITGVGILISLVTELGGIALLSKWLQALASPKTAAAIMGVLAGVMSWFSSASGVVMPTLFPAGAEMAANMPGVDAMSVVVAVGIGSHMAAMSPVSSCGGLTLAAYSSGNVTAEDRNKMFLQLFLLSATGVLFGGLLALLGLY
ncbi:MAG: hypothetical protein IJB75_08550 [Oscillospiraceae bacterium]|nr:hypothetical protein [Oscillospiraceae bacterium]